MRQARPHVRGALICRAPGQRAQRAARAGRESTGRAVLLAFEIPSVWRKEEALKVFGGCWIGYRWVPCTTCSPEPQSKPGWVKVSGGPAINCKPFDSANGFGQTS